MILKNAKIISPADNLDEILDIKIEDGVIVDVSRNIVGRDCYPDSIDFEGKIIVPGFVDMHCHLREPGFEYKETIETGLKAAQNGGYVAVCPMANTNPVADNVETIKYELDKAKNLGVKVFPIAAASKGLNGEELTDFEALKEAGAVAFSDDGKPFKDMELFRKMLQTGELIISHAEDEADEVEEELEILKNVSGQSVCNLHFAHISTKHAVESIRKAKEEGLQVTCETAPHYFTFTKEDETADGRFKMNPPLRTKDDLEAVIEGLKDGTIDCIATDHAPHSLEEKTKPFSEAPFGIVGFETALGVSLKLVQDGYLTINQLIEKLSVNPTKILGLSSFGSIKIGQKANLTIIDPDVEYIVKAEEFKSKCKISPFEGMIFKGKAIAVIVNGYPSPKFSNTRE